MAEDPDRDTAAVEVYFHSRDSSNAGSSARELPMKIKFSQHSSSVSSVLSPSASSPGSLGECILALRAGVVEELIKHVERRQVEWQEAERKFDQLAVAAPGKPPAVKSADFMLCIGMEKTPEFASELLRALRTETKDPGWITKPELLEYWRRLGDPRFSSRVQIFLDMCRNTEGEITEKGMKEMIRLSATANNLSISQEEAEEYTRLIMESVLDGNLSLKNHAREAPRKKQELEEGPQFRRSAPPSAAEVLLRAYWRQTLFISLWLISCAALFTWKFEQYRRRRAFQIMGYCLCAAKGAAETLKLNMALVLLPISRNTITWLRRRRHLSFFVPFNDSINFHKLVAGGIVVGVILHGGTHLACDFPRIAGANTALFRQTIAGNFRQRQPTYLQILATTEVATGLAMVVLMVAAFGLATEYLRRVAGFNTFWYSHHIFIAVYGLLIVHSMFLFLTKDFMEKTTWMYIAVPVLIYIGERVIRAIRSQIYDVNIIEAATYPGNVLSLRFQKPAGFSFRSGMYIYVKCPSISAFEWHPFSLTSGPDEEHLSIHIRILGDWSRQIYALFDQALISGESGFPELKIDGPFGSATQDHVKYDVTVLIGLGIGATPFVSVLKDLIHRRRHDSVVFSGASSARKAYFYWVTRDQSSFDWLRDVMKEISAADQKQTVVEMHSYLTSIFDEDDPRSTVIGTAQALYHARSGLDIVSRTPVLTHFARPNWARLFSGLASRHQGERIGVFYCGPRGLSANLRKLCHKMTTKSHTRFIFHMENY